VRDRRLPRPVEEGGDRARREDGSRAPREDGSPAPRESGNPAPQEDGNPAPLEDGDRALLEFMAEHRLVHAAHAQRLLGESRGAALARLRRLGARGYVRRERPFGGPRIFHLITATGLRAVGSALPAPKFRLSCHEHDIGVAWLWLAARAGAFGPLRGVLGERRMRSLDATVRDRGQPLAVRLGGVGAGGRERLHYPDLLLLTRTGRRVAVELELSAKGRQRRERILAGYAADARVDAVLYLVSRRSTGRAIQASARRLGIHELVHVQLAAVRVGGDARADPPLHPTRRCGRPAAAASR
jgi:hypothetical protein